MKTEPCYYVGTHHYSFRPGKPALILGVVSVTPDGEEPRPCFHVRYPDGVEDYSPISASAELFRLAPAAGVDPGSMRHADLT